MLNRSSSRLSQRNNVAVSSAFPEQITVQSLLAPSTEVHPPHSTPNIASGRRPSKGSNLGNIPAAVQSNTKSLITFKNRTPDTPQLVESGSQQRASSDSKPVIVSGSDVKSVPDSRSKKTLPKGAIVAQQFATKGKLLFPQWPTFTTPLSMEALFIPTPLDFFRWYSQNARVGEVSVLSFNLPDVTWQRHQWNIDRDDSDAFYAIKRIVWESFCISMINHPGTAVFRVIVEAVARDGMGKAPAASKIPGLSSLQRGGGEVIARKIF
jgi:hypothetical protein